MVHVAFPGGFPLHEKHPGARSGLQSSMALYCPHVHWLSVDEIGHALHEPALLYQPAVSIQPVHSVLFVISQAACRLAQSVRDEHM